MSRPTEQDRAMARKMAKHIIDNRDRMNYTAHVDATTDVIANAIAEARGGPDFGPETDTHEDRGYPAPRCDHQWGLNGCQKCGQPAMPRG